LEKNEQIEVEPGFARDSFLEFGPRSLNGTPEEVRAACKRGFRKAFEHLVSEQPEGLRAALRWKWMERVESFSPFVPRAQRSEVPFQRLWVPSLVGSLLFGLLFLQFLGPLFLEDFYAFVVGAPIGGAFFVWLFAKMSRHPRFAKAVRWSIGIGVGALSISLLFSKIRGWWPFQKNPSWLQWIGVLVLSLLTIWMLYIFRPKQFVDEKERERALEFQWDVAMQALLDDMRKNPGAATTPAALPSPQAPQPGSLDLSASGVRQALEQLLQATQRSEGTGQSDASQQLLWALKSQGIQPLQLDPVFTFSSQHLDFFEPFGVVSEGDQVEVLQNAWVDAQGRPLVKGRIRKKR